MTEGPTRRTRVAVRLAFAAVAALWCAQVVMMGAGMGEPYPGITMPSFPGAAGYADGVVELERMEAVFVGPDGGEAAFSPRALFAPYPDSHHGTLAGYLSPGPPHVRPWRDRLRRALLPGLAAGRADRRPGCPHPSLRAWARGRAADLLPGRPVQGLELRWSRDTYRPGPRARVPIRSEPAGVFAIPLDGGAACAG